MANGRLLMVVALPAEGKPLIAHWQLHRRPDVVPFPLFVSSDQKRWLIQCGIGKIAAATAVGFLAQLANAQRSDAWLNVGIAGSGSFELGSLVIGHKIIDEGAGKNWYPSQLFQGPRLQLCPSTTIRTVDVPLQEYPPDAVVEMEAAGFCGAAMRFSSVELVQAIKVISDTPQDSLEGITKERVQRWIGNQLESIELVANELLELSDEVASLVFNPKYFDEVASRVHFTVAQSHQLTKLLRRWEILSPESAPLEFLAKKATAKEVLAELKSWLGSTPIEFSSVDSKSGSHP